MRSGSVVIAALALGLAAPAPAEDLDPPAEAPGQEHPQVEEGDELLDESGFDEVEGPALDRERAAETSASDAGIAEAIRQRLDEAEFVQTDELDVLVEDGVVTLRGVVEEEYEMDEAVKLVSSVDGVVDVRNKILVGPPRPGASDIRTPVPDADGHSEEGARDQ